MWIGDDATRRVPIGFVADFCLVCQEMEFMAAARLVPRNRGIVRLLAGSSDRGPLETTCLRCKTPLLADPDRYLAFERANRDSPTAFAERTLRDAREVLRDAKDRLATLAAGHATREMREGHLFDALASVECMTQRAVGGSNLSLGSAMAVIVLIAAVPAAVAAPQFGMPAWARVACWATVAVLGVFLVWDVIDGRRRWVRRRVTPLIARACRPLRPSVEELENVIQVARGEGLIIARRVRARDIHNAIELNQ